jgi:hypothetical protein
MTKIIAFGNGSYYSKLAIKLLNKIKKKYPNFEYRAYSEIDIPKSIYDYSKTFPSGFGHKIWKPFIVLDSLYSIGENDVLIYIDSRSYFTSNKISWIENFLDSYKDIGIWRLSDLHGFEHKEYQFTISDLFKLLKSTEEDIITDQFASTLFCLRNNMKTRALMEEWLLFHKKYLAILEVHENGESTNLPGFLEKRYDQSTFSLLVKRELRNNLDGMIFTNEEIHSKNSIRVHFWPRENRLLSYIMSYLRLIFPRLFRAFRPLYFFYLRVKIKNTRKSS